MVVTKRIVITIGWVLVLLSTALLFFTIQLNSTTLFFEDLARNIFLYQGQWRAWQFTPTPAYIPSVALYFIAFKILPLPTDRILFVTIAEALLIAGAAIWFAKKIQYELSTIAKTAILTMIALTSFIAAHSNMRLYFDPANSQIPSFLFSLLALGFILKYLVSKKNISLFKFLITIIVAIVCDQLFIIGFYSTAIIILLFYVICLNLKSRLTQYKKYQIPLLNSLVVVILAYPIAKVITYFVKSDHAKIQPPPFSYLNLTHSWAQFKLTIIHLFYPFNIFILFYLVIILLALMICFILFIKLFSFEIKRQGKIQFNPTIKVQFVGKADDPFTFCLFFLVFLLPINFIGTILSGGFQDGDGLRYFMLPIGLAFILVIVYLDSLCSINKEIGGGLAQRCPQLSQYLDKDKPLFSMYVYCLMAALFIGIIITLIQQLHHHGWQRIQFIRHQGAEIAHHEMAIAECVQQVQKAKSLRAGIADYWHSRGVALRLKNYIPIMAMHSDLTPKTWLNTQERYLSPKKYNIKYDFIILEKNGKLFNANAESPFLPTGYEQHICENAPVEIWTYPNGLLNTFLQAQIYKSFFVNNEINQLIWPAKLLTGNVGKVQDDVRIASAPQDQAGLLGKGLYFNLTPGYYKITVNYKARTIQPKRPVGEIIIGRFNAPVHHKLLLKEALYSNNTIITDYVLVTKTKYSVQEVRVWFAGHGSLTISSIEFERLGAGSFSNQL